MDNVKPLFAVNALSTDNAGIAKNLRLLADAIEGGEFLDVDNVACVISCATIETTMYGRPVSIAGLVGLLTCAANKECRSMGDDS